MTDQPSYRFRRNLFERERTVALTDEGLHWSDDRAEGRIAYSGISEIRIYSVMGTQYSPASWRCTVYPVQGRKLDLTSLHFAGLGDFEDRLPAMLAFSREFVRRAAAKNPSIVFMEGLPRAAWFLSLFILAVTVAGVAFGGVIFALLLVEASLSPVSLLLFAGGLVGGAGIAFAIWQWLKRSWPQPFDPLKKDPFAGAGESEKPNGAGIA